MNSYAYANQIVFFFTCSATFINLCTVIMLQNVKITVLNIIMLENVKIKILNDFFAVHSYLVHDFQAVMRPLVDIFLPYFFFKESFSASFE